ncbi:MAG: acetyl-CoA carboxylase biotin carboxylase subunit [Bacteroidota bacterium]
MKKILVANRGEIALRIIKSIQKMGIKSVAIYSEIDRNAPHVLAADEAVCIGKNPSNQSYLLIDKIIETALNLGVDGIHPGYGFLSENADFAQKVTDAGIVFIGPRPESIKIMGSKLAAKDCVKKYNIPMVPGLESAIEDIPFSKKKALEIGYPILIKASAGGGGKGMRIVESEAEFDQQLERAISEASSSFGDGSVFIEKYVSSPRHIEIQILADNYGNTVHLFERECSIQRRHQKVVEEAPSAILSEEIRAKMGEAAVLVAKSCNYTGVGTVEFLLDENLNFYFLEMNTRLQVEHPVTEMITGLDLVEQQIKVANGEPLSLVQSDLKINGHSIELRIYAEDPLNDFLPSVGNLTAYKKPTGQGVRVDDGYREQMEIPIYYDPMIAKLTVHASNRLEAIQKMKQAIIDFKIEGVATTLPFGKFVMEHDSFINGLFDTHFVKKYFDPSKLLMNNSDSFKAAAILALKLYLKESQKTKVAENTLTNWTITNR